MSAPHDAVPWIARRRHSCGARHDGHLPKTCLGVRTRPEAVLGAHRSRGPCRARRAMATSNWPALQGFVSSKCDLRRCLEVPVILVLDDNMPQVGEGKAAVNILRDRQ